jgi:hypothetical protein
LTNETLRGISCEGGAEVKDRVVNLAQLRQGSTLTSVRARQHFACSRSRRFRQPQAHIPCLDGLILHLHAGFLHCADDLLRVVHARRVTVAQGGRRLVVVDG